LNHGIAVHVHSLEQPAAPASRWTRVERAALMLLGAFAVLVGIASLWWPFGWDAGIFTWVADTIRHGGLPYRDAWDQKGPFSFYTYALLQALVPSGDAMWPLRALDLVLVTAAAIAMADIVRRLVPGTAGIWAAIVLVLGHYVTDFWNTAQPDGWIAFLSTVGMALLLRDDFGRRWWPGLAAGFLMGIGMLQKPTFAVLIPLPALAVLLRGERPVRWRLERAVAYTAVALLPLLAGIVWFWHLGILPSVVEGYLLLNLEIARALVGGVARGVTFTLYKGLETRLALVIPAAVVGFAWLWRTNRRAALLLGAWVGGALLGIASQRRFWGYHWHPFYWSVGPLAATGFVVIARQLSGAARTFAGDLLVRTSLAMLVFVLVLPLQTHVRDWVALMSGRLSHQEFLDQFEEDQIDIVEDDLALADYLKRHSGPQDRVFVWDSPLANALADRRTPGRVGFFVALVLPKANGRGVVPLGPIQQRLRQEFLASLDDSSTRYVAVTRDALIGREGMLRKGLPKLFPELEQKLATQWAVVDTAGGYRIFARRAQGLATTAP
jgi:4-amino-4-deoxy-L-arabinose transferase-like glycosyltransferase